MIIAVSEFYLIYVIWIMLVSGWTLASMLEIRQLQRLLSNIIKVKFNYEISRFWWRLYLIIFSQALFEYIFHHENSIREAMELAAQAVVATKYFKTLFHNCSKLFIIKFLDA